MKTLVAAALAFAALGCSTPEPTPVPPPQKCVYLAGFTRVGNVMVPYYRPCPQREQAAG